MAWPLAMSVALFALVAPAAALDDPAKPRPPLVVAASTGDDAAITRLLLEGASPNSRNEFPYRFSLHGASPSAAPENHKSALMYAAEGGYVEAVKQLLKAGARPNATTVYGETALMFAARKGHVSVLRALIDGGADLNAVASDDKEVEVKYRDYGGSALAYALRNKQLAAAEAIVGGYEKSRKSVADADRVLAWALPHADARLVSRLADLGTVKRGSPALLYIGTDDRADVVKLLAAAGADVNARSAKPWDDTPLMRAAMNGAVRTLGVLLDGGAKVDAATTHGETALWHAARKKHVQAVALLLARGANPNLVTKPSPQWFSPGGSALGIAVEGGCLECARELLARGADPRVPDASGKTPLEALRKAGLIP